MLQGFCSVKIFWLPQVFAYFEKWKEVGSIFFVMLVFDLLCVHSCCMTFVQRLKCGGPWMGKLFMFEQRCCPLFDASGQKKEVGC
jgi:hypothetical protein